MHPASRLCDSAGRETRAVVLFVKDSFHQVRLFLAPIWCASGDGGMRGKGHCRGKPSRKQQHAQAYFSPRYRVSKSQRLGEDGAQIDRRRTKGVRDPCARETKARTETFFSRKLISDHGLFSAYEGQQGVMNGQHLWGLF